ncbi:Ribose-5-phosphate isomerase A [bacterium HR36]|nr:Ribose-5-phosphate isomerase A [bacterium HR36]
MGSGAEATGRESPNIREVLRQRLRPGMRLGLGGGRTVASLLPHLAALHREGWNFSAVAAAQSTAQLAQQLGIALADTCEASGDRDPSPGPLDLLLDGADEVDPQLDLIKGYGGALTREKILACAAQQRVYVVSREKLVPVLGSRGKLPIEVLPFGWRWTQQAVAGVLQAPIELRRNPDGSPYVTDNGSYILDCRIGCLADAWQVAQELRQIPGVVETGLFLGLADTVLVLEGGAVRVLQRQRNYPQISAQPSPESGAYPDDEVNEASNQSGETPAIDRS